MDKMHHPKSDVDRLHVPRKCGARGLTQLETSYKIATVGLRTFLKRSDDPFLLLVQMHDVKKMYSVQKETQTFFRKFDLSELPKEGKRTKQKAQRHAKGHLSGPRERKALPGKCPKRMKDAYVDLHGTSQWLTSSGLKAEMKVVL